ncbi:Hypothetical predicted protein [Olea europaea subsp. europaea]|uniref:Uncharacterized protein n=1 Tax=Olea europaea subsp. europaea TaxID=158383 RepID=A0A8S0UQK0_OLEEU|nr:Hypothetical predicted protein [Olea europaea subsp. europaea]
MQLRTVKFKIVEHVSDEFKNLREFISIVVFASSSITTAPIVDINLEPRESDVRGGDTDFDPFCAEPQVGRGHHPSPDNHDEEMGIDMQEGNVSGDGMDPEPPVHDNEEACVNSGDGDDEEVPHVSVGNIE